MSVGDPQLQGRRQQEKDFLIFWFSDLLISWFYDFMILWFPDLLISWFPDFLISWFPDILVSWSPDFLGAPLGKGLAISSTSGLVSELPAQWITPAGNPELGWTQPEIPKPFTAQVKDLQRKSRYQMFGEFLSVHQQNISAQLSLSNLGSLILSKHLSIYQQTSRTEQWGLWQLK